MASPRARLRASRVSWSATMAERPPCRRSPASARSPRSGSAWKGSGTGCAAARSAVRTITRFDPSPFQSRIAGAGRRLPRHRPPGGATGPAARPVRAVHASRPTRLALGDAELDLAQEDRDRVGVDDGHRARRRGLRRGAARALHARGACATWTPSLALMVFAGAVELQRGDRVRRAPGPTRTNGMSCASGTIAIGDGFRCHRRGARPT